MICFIYQGISELLLVEIASLGQVQMISSCHRRVEHLALCT